MSNILNQKDEMIMHLVHYFVTEEDYSPINIRGIQNEIWLENLNAPYKIIRINSKYIHNNDQYDMDLMQTNFIAKQIKVKTLSFKMNILNICLDMNDFVDVNNNFKNISTVAASKLSDIKNNKIISSVFPKIKTKLTKKGTDDLDNLIETAEDINRKTLKENKKFEDIFKPKKIIVTKILIALNVLIFILSYINPNILYMFSNIRVYVLNGEWYRCITSAFLHANIIHLVVNMYSLWVIGSQVETYIGKWKYLVIYILSAIMGSLLSLVFLGNNISLGASGAIFGLMGCLLYFGYHYRLYLKNALTHQIIPIILINLFLGFMYSSIDNAAHIGGLIGGYLATMIVGLKYEGSKNETINGIIVYILLTVFLVYALFNLV